MGKFKKGVRVRLTEMHDDGGPEVGALGTIFAKGPDKGDRDVIWDDLDGAHDGEANDGSTNHWYVPKSKLEVVEDEPAKRFTIGDRATALDGEQVTIDSEIDDVDHVWVVNADGKRWRTPASWLSEAWVPKVGDRVRCDDNQGAPLAYTVGQVYTVKDVQHDRLVWTEETDGAMFAHRFSPLPAAADAESAGLTIEAVVAVEAVEPAVTPATAGVKVGDRVGDFGTTQATVVRVEGERFAVRWDGDDLDGPVMWTISEWEVHQPANDNVSVNTLTLTLNSEPLADAFRTIAAALNQAADSIGKAA